MSADQAGDRVEAVLSRERVSTLMLAVCTAIALYVCYRIIHPFIPAVAFAVALAVATHRPYQWIRSRVGSDMIAAMIAIICVSLLILVPLVMVSSYIVQAALQNIEELRAGGGLAKLRQEAQALPLIGPWIEHAGQRLNLQDQLMQFGQGAAAGASGLLAGSFGALTQIAITIFVLFFLYRDEVIMRKAFMKLLPLEPQEAEKMASRVAGTIQATVNGSLTVSACQAALATTIYGILGVPMFILWGLATFFAAFVPIFGTSLIWIPVCLYLLLSGAWIKAVILVCWAALAIGSIDNLLYPWLVGDKLKVHTLLTFFSVIGGVGLFGPSGIILGPMVLAIMAGLLDVWGERLRPNLT